MLGRFNKEIEKYLWYDPYDFPFLVETFTFVNPSSGTKLVNGFDIGSNGRIFFTFFGNRFLYYNDTIVNSSYLKKTSTNILQSATPTDGTNGFNSGKSIENLIYTPNNNLILVGGVSTTIVSAVSSDNGGTWSYGTFGTTTPQNIETNSVGRVYVTCSSSTGYYSDNGTTWTAKAYGVGTNYAVNYIKEIDTWLFGSASTSLYYSQNNLSSISSVSSVLGQNPSNYMYCNGRIFTWGYLASIDNGPLSICLDIKNVTTAGNWIKRYLPFGNNPSACHHYYNLALYSDITDSYYFLPSIERNQSAYYPCPILKLYNDKEYLFNPTFSSSERFKRGVVDFVKTLPLPGQMIDRIRYYNGSYYIVDRSYLVSTFRVYKLTPFSIL